MDYPKVYDNINVADGLLHNITLISHNEGTLRDNKERLTESFVSVMAFNEIALVDIPSVG